MASRSLCASRKACAQNGPRKEADGYCGYPSRAVLAAFSFALPGCPVALAIAESRHSARDPQPLLLLDDFVTLSQLLSQYLILFSQMNEFFFKRHALTLLGLLPFGKSPADLGSYSSGKKTKQCAARAMKLG